MTHPLHEYIAKQLGEKLRAKKVVVWYDARSEFAQGFLSRKDFPGRPRKQQPSRQSFFAGTGPRAREIFKKRCLAEQVQIARIGMGWIEKTLARLAGSRPAISG